MPADPRSQGPPRQPAAPAIRTRGLRRVFDEHVAVDGLDLEVRGGETMALLGPNGAGKTTTAAMLTTLLPPSAGEAWVAGHSVAAEPDEVRRRIGVVFQGPSLELQLSARQNLRFHAKLYRIPRTEAEARAEALLKEASLQGREDDAVWKFSGGMRRRLEIARAVMHRPRVLFLDEPTTGLDPQARRYTWEMLERLQREEGMAVLLTTHDMHEADRLAHRVAIMDRGRLIGEVDTPQALKAALGDEVLVLRFEGEARARLHAPLEGLPGVGGVEWDGREARLHATRADRLLPEVVELARKHGATLEGMELHKPTLEDVFIARTGRHLREGEGSESSEDSEGSQGGEGGPRRAGMGRKEGRA